MKTPLSPGMYTTDRDRKVFGEHFCGPDELPHMKAVIVARYEKDPEGGDGQPVEVYCWAAPARFYKVVAEPARNSIDKMKAGFTLSTASGMGDWAAATATLISQGALAVEVPSE